MTACANRLATIIPYGGTDPLNGGELTDTKSDSGHLGDLHSINKDRINNTVTYSLSI